MTYPEVRLPMVKVLLLWELLPECIKVYRLSVDSGIYEKLKACHGRLAQTVGFPDDLEAWLNSFMDPCPGELVYDSSLSNCAEVFPPIALREGEHLIMTGFAL